MRVIFKLIRTSGIPWIIREVFQRNRVTILLFHDISPKAAEKSFAYLKERYNVIGLQEYLKARKDPSCHKLPPKSLIVTFDDGHKQNYELLPLLKRLEFPITIFLCSSIIGTGRGFWFLQPNLSKPVGHYKKLTNQERLIELERSGFKQEQDMKEREALNKKEIEEMKELVDFQSHTMFHPCLPKCNPQEAKVEIEGSKHQLEKDFGLTINTLSYPNGDYSDRDLSLTRSSGYTFGITVDTGFNTLSTDPLLLKRISVNDTGDINQLAVKASGIWSFFKNRVFGRQSYGYSKTSTE